MATPRSTKNNRNNSTFKKVEDHMMNPLVGAVIGATAGAVVGSVMIRLMSDKDARRRAGEFLNRSIDLLKDINEEPKGTQSLLERTVDKAADTTKRYIQER